MTKTRIGTMVSYEQVSATNQLILLPWKKILIRMLKEYDKKPRNAADLNNPFNLCRLFSFCFVIAC
jgi:hypothetical protein